MLTLGCARAVGCAVVVVVVGEEAGLDGCGGTEEGFEAEEFIGCDQAESRMHTVKGILGASRGG